MVDRNYDGGVPLLGLLLRRPSGGRRLGVLVAAQGGRDALLLRLHGHARQRAARTDRDRQREGWRKAARKKPKVKTARTAEGATRCRAGRSRRCRSVAKAKLAVDRFFVEDLVLPVWKLNPARSSILMPTTTSSTRSWPDGNTRTRRSVRRLVFLIGGQYGLDGRSGRAGLCDGTGDRTPLRNRRQAHRAACLSPTSSPARSISHRHWQELRHVLPGSDHAERGRRRSRTRPMPVTTIRERTIDKFDLMLADSDLTALCPRGTGNAAARTDRCDEHGQGRADLHREHPPGIREGRGSSIRDSFRPRVARHSFSRTRRITSTRLPVLR